MKIITHSDNDGKVSAFWAWYNENYLYRTIANYIEGEPTPDSIYVCNYTEEDDTKVENMILEKVREGEKIYIVDYSIPTRLMDLLIEKDCDIIWIDHHFSSISKYDDYPNMDKIHGIRVDGVAACELTFVYLFVMTDHGIRYTTEVNFDEKMLENVPRFTKLVGDQDVWKFKYGEDTKAFNTYINNLKSISDATGRLWLYLIDDYVYCKNLRQFILENITCEVRLDRCIDVGKSMREISTRISSEYAINNEMLVSFEGYNCCYIYIPDSGNSEDLNFYLSRGSDEMYKALENNDIGIVHRKFGDNYQYSLYSIDPDINCAKIAEKYGGGGHKGAAGFTLKKPLDIKIIHHVGDLDKDKLYKWNKK